MKKIISFLLMFLIPLSAHASTYEVTTASNNVGIGSTNPGQALDVQGTVRALDILGVSSVTKVVCASTIDTATSHWRCDYKATATNSQTAINQAITDVNALTNGGTVQLTEGTFTIGNNGTSITPLSNVWLKGSGMYSTILASTTGLTVNANILQTNALTNVKMSDFKIDGTAQRAASWNVQEKGISTPNDSNTHMTFRDLWIYNTPATCLANDGVADIFYENNIFENCGTAAHGGFGSGNNGIGWGDGVSGQVKNIVATNNLAINVVDTAYLFEIQSGTPAAQNFVVSNNIAINGLIGIEDTGMSNFVASGNLITGMSGTGCSGIYIGTDDASGTNVTDVTLTGNQIVGNSCNGMDLSATTPRTLTNVSVVGNDIRNNTGYGIKSFSGFTTIANNIISDNGDDGIYWLSGQSVSGLTITGNQINNNGSAALSQHQNGISLKINSTFTLTNLTISNNDINNNAGYGLDTELSAGTFTNFRLTNNNFVSNTTAATLLTGSTFTVGTNFFPFGNHGYTTNYLEGGPTTLASNVGIGSLNPGKQLDVNGTVRANFFVGDGSGITGIAGGGTVNSGTVNNEAVYSGSTTVGSGIITDNATNVGVGSTTPAQKLDVQGTVKSLGLSIGTTTTNATLFIDQAVNNNVNGMQISNNAQTGNVKLWVDGANQARLDGGSTGNLNLVINGASGGGGVGIGTSTPANFFQISSAPGTSSSTASQLTNRNGHDWIWRAFGSASATTPNGLSLFDNSNSKNTLVIDGSDNIGIGSTVPGAQLDVNGTVRAFGFTTYGSGTSSTTGSLSVGTTANTNKLDVQGNASIGTAYAGIATAASNGLLVQGNSSIGTTSTTNSLNILGNVGIGTLNGDPYLTTAIGSGSLAVAGNMGVGSWIPENQLVIRANSSAGSTGEIVNSNSAGVSTLFVKNDAGNIAELIATGSTYAVPGILGILATTGQSFSIGKTSGAINMTVGGTGNVGIGSTSPGAALDVNGTVRITALTSGTVLCNLNGSIGHCTSGASCLSTCTCTCVVP